MPIDIDFSNPLASKLAETQPQEEQENRIVKAKAALAKLLTEHNLSQTEKVVILSETLASLSRLEIKSEWQNR